MGGGGEGKAIWVIVRTSEKTLATPLFRGKKELCGRINYYFWKK